MARKSNYHRSFIILKPKSRGFEFVPNKAPTGYCKFEIRRGVGRAYIYMQDIKPSSSLDGNYEAYLISADDSIRPCKLAGLYTDEQGRCEHIVSFDADDIKGSGYTLENFHALVIAFRTGREGMTCLSLNRICRQGYLHKHQKHHRGIKGDTRGWIRGFIRA